MRALVLVVVLLAAAACGAYQFPGGNPSSTPTPQGGTVSGRVLAVPCSPAEQPGNTCVGRPVPKLELDYLTDGQVAASAVTDSGGGYRVALPPGTYDVKLKTYMRVLKGPLTLTVASGSNLLANYLLDTGIRAPVPQQ